MSSALRIDQPVSCDREGTGHGENRAELYCKKIGDDPIGERLELSLCDQIAAFHCKQAFYRKVNEDDACKMKAQNDPDFENLVNAACAPPD